MKESLKIIDRENIDVNRWDQLVESNIGTSVFCHSWYLDAVAENWSIIVDDNYTCGMPLPYATRMGVCFLYTPIFVRYVEWIGDDKLLGQSVETVKSCFSLIELSCKDTIFDGLNKSFVFQKIEKSDELKLSSQAERSLKKASKENYHIRETRDFESVLGMTTSLLTDKHEGLTQKSMNHLGELFNNAKAHERLIAFEVWGDSFLGGVICISSSSTLLYVKGSVVEEAKKNGGMYLAIHHAIEYARKNGLDFDFGGSRIDGVKSFNHNLGGKDTVYYAYEINNAPVWFNAARRLKKIWAKK